MVLEIVQGQKKCACIMVGCGHNMLFMHNISEHEDWFSSFAAAYTMAKTEEKGMLDLKVLHTFKVLEHMRVLLCEEALLAPYGRACLLAALYHDVARFPQYARWRTFKDSASANHGLWGAKILKEKCRLSHESPEIRRQVRAAVALHNRFALPCGLPEDVRLITEAVRDADKLDIMRIMDGHFNDGGSGNSAVVLHVADEPLCWTPQVVEDVRQGRVAAYADLHYVNDFKLLIGSWLHELRFAATRRALAAQGYMARILEGLPNDPGVVAARERIEAGLALLAGPLLSVPPLQPLQPLRPMHVAHTENTSAAGGNACLRG